MSQGILLRHKAEEKDNAHGIINLIHGIVWPNTNPHASCNVRGARKHTQQWQHCQRSRNDHAPCCDFSNDAGDMPRRGVNGCVNIPIGRGVSGCPLPDVAAKYADMLVHSPTTVLFLRLPLVVGQSNKVQITLSDQARGVARDSKVHKINTSTLVYGESYYDALCPASKHFFPGGRHS